MKPWLVLFVAGLVFNNAGFAQSIPLPTVHWTFDGLDRTQASDSGSAGVDLILHNQPQSFRDLVPFSSGRGRSMRFHNLSNHFGEASGDALNPERQNFSVSLWFKIWNPRSPGFLISKGNGISTEEGWSLFTAEVNGTLSLIWRVNQVPGESQRAGLSIPIDPASQFGWHHVVGVIDRDKNLVAAYLNGDPDYDNRHALAQAQNFKWRPLRSASLTNASIDSEDKARVAIRNDDSYGFSGWIDDIRIYKGLALTQDQAGLLASEDFLRFDDKTVRALNSEDSAGLISVEPVVVPDETNTPSGNRHFGWPVAASIGEKIVVAYNRQRYHGGRTENYRGWGGTRNSDSSHTMVVQSNNNGRTWGNPENLDTLVTPSASPLLATNMHAIGVSNGKITLLSEAGLFTQSGNDWSYSADAYTRDKVTTFPFENSTPVRAHIGPRLIQIEDRLCAFHTSSYPRGVPKLVIGVNQGVGGTWRQGQWRLPHPDRFRLSEPVAFVHDERIILLSRCGGLRDELVVFVAKERGLPTDIGFPFYEKTTPFVNLPSRHQDTGDIFYNPITRKIEVLLTHRGRDPGEDSGSSELLTLSLWSIRPEDLLNDSSHADFAYEATLLRRRHRKGVGAPRGYDGFHVAASIVREREQLIFFYSGYNKQGPVHAPGAGIFQLRRTLDTNRLVQTLQSIE